MHRRLLAVVGTMATAIAMVPLTPSPAGASGAAGDFVRRSGSVLTLRGKPFPIVGTNNYYLTYKSQAMVDDVLGDAAAAGFTVLRSWGWVDIGAADGSGSVTGKADGVYYQYWDGSAPAYNDGEDGLAHLDYTVWKAGQLGLKLVIPFTNNWSDFGGMDQYVRWRGAKYHDDFYTDPVIRGWYKNWISHLLGHVNPRTGLAYKDDPTIMTWELGNEPRCGGSGVYPKSGTCTTQTLLTWADEMTRHVKSIDRRHLTSVGDEGFFCDDPASTDWTVNCGEGVDTVALAKLPAVDVLSFHLYPNGWGKTPADQWGVDWIKRHFAEARKIRKPAMLGEFGLLDKATRNVVYRHWTDAVITSGGAGFLYWILSGVTDDGSLYPDYDGFTVYCPSPVCTTIGNAGKVLRGRPASFPPVADNDTVVTPFGTPVTFEPAANDIGYVVAVDPATIDLDPATAGQQRSFGVAGGTFTAADSGAVTFTPVEGYFGKAVATYTVRDAVRRMSNPAQITVTVKPDPTAAVRLYSFEDGVQGWAPGNWQANAGTVEQTTDYATDGTHGLKIISVDGGWFGAALPEPVDFSTHGTLAFDLQTGGSGTSRSVALQTGAGWSWCQSPFVWIGSGQTTHVELDIATDLAGCGDGLTDVRGMLIFFNSGTFVIDNVMLI